MPPARRAILALFAIVLALYGPPTYRTLRILGVIPQTFPPPLFPLISSSGSASASEVITIPNTRHCEDLHHHAPSNLLFTACEGASSPRFHWFPPLGHFDRPEDVLEGAERGERGGLVVVDPKVRLSAPSYSPASILHSFFHSRKTWLMMGFLFLCRYSVRNGWIWRGLKGRS